MPTDTPLTKDFDHPDLADYFYEASPFTGGFVLCRHSDHTTWSIYRAICYPNTAIYAFLCIGGAIDHRYPVVKILKHHGASAGDSHLKALTDVVRETAMRADLSSDARRELLTTLVRVFKLDAEDVVVPPDLKPSKAAPTRTLITAKPRTLLSKIQGALKKAKQRAQEPAHKALKTKKAPAARPTAKKAVRGKQAPKKKAR